VLFVTLTENAADVNGNSKIIMENVKHVLLIVSGVEMEDVSGV